MQYLRLLGNHLGTTPSEGQRFSVPHAISPHQLHSSSSVSTGLQVGPQCAQVGLCTGAVPQTTHRTNSDITLRAPWPQESRSGTWRWFPQSFNCYTRKCPPHRLSSACNFLPCHLHGRQFQGPGAGQSWWTSPDTPSGFHWVSVTRSRGLNRIVVERLWS